MEDGGKPQGTDSSPEVPSRGLTKRALGRSAAALAAGGGVAALLAACGRQEAGPAGTGAGRQFAATLVVNHTDARREGPVYEEIYRAAEARFPGLKLDLTLGGPEKVLAMFAAGTPMDVIRLSGSRDFTNFACKGLLLAVDEFLKRRGEYPAQDAMPIAMQGSPTPSTASST